MFKYAEHLQGPLLDDAEHSRRVTSAGDAASRYSPAEYPRHRPVPSTWCSCRAWWVRFWRPRFCRSNAAIHEALISADLLAVVELREKGPPRRQEHPGLFPLAQSAPAGRGAAISRGSSLHGAPVRRTHGMPSKRRRGPARGWRSWGRRFSRGRCDRIRSHCASVSARHAMPPRYRPLPLNPRF